MTARLLGAVLAGGAGRRLGGPKADVVLDGVSMVQRSVAVLREAVGEVVVVSSRALGPVDAEVVPDLTPDAGPLGGLEAALAHAAGSGFEGVLLMACDLPLVSPELLTAVMVGLGDAPAAAPVRASAAGGIEPLCAAYRNEVLAAVRVRLAEEDRSMHALFRSVAGRVVPVAELGPAPAKAFLNVNTPADLRRASAALAGDGEA